MGRITMIALAGVLAWYLGATDDRWWEVAAAENDFVRKDWRFILKLRWMSPHVELPGTCAEYLQRHTSRSALFARRSVRALLPW